MNLLTVDTLVPAKLSKRSYKVGSTGLLFKDSFNFCKSCANYQMTEKITRKDMMTLNPILEVEIFNVWGIDFMRLFPSSFGNQYILVAVDYVSK